MKRRISLLLAVVMILGSFSFVFAAEESAEAKAGEFLKKVDVLEGINGDLKLGDNLRRQDMVVLIARLHGEEEAAKKFPAEELTFKDFSDPYYKPIIAWAVANNLIVGHTAERFGFNEDVTAQQYATVLLRALGYNDKVATDEGYAKALEEAKKLDILKDLKVEDATVVTRGQMAVMTFNALGTNMKDSDKTLAEKLGIEMPEAAKLEAEVKDTENLKEVIVNLSNAKLANKDKLENTANYRLKGNTIERVEVKDNDVLVQVKDAFRSGKQYELEIKGVDKAIDGKYKFIAKDNTIPSVEKVEVLGEYGIKVITSEPIEDVRGKNFLVDGKYTVMNVETYGRNLVLTPYNGSFPSGAKTLTIEGLRDYAGYKSAKEDFDIEIVKDNEAPKVEDVILKGNKVEVVFDKDIYKDSVDAYYSRSDVGNISYELGRHTVYADEAKKIDTNKISYEFKDNEAPSRRDDVTIVDVTNHSKVKMEKTTIALREVLDDIEPEIIETKISRDIANEKATIKLYFDKDVTGSFENDKSEKTREEKGFVVKDHFTLYEDEVSNRNKLDGKDDPKITSAKYYYNDKEKEYEKDVIEVVIEGLEVYDRKTNDVEYVLEIEGFADASSSRNKMYRDYYEFKFSKSSDFVVKTVDVKGRRPDTEIEIEFSKKLDREIAEDATNYTFYELDKGKKVMGDDVEALEGEVILKSNGYIVTLEIPEEWKDLDYDYDGLRISDAIKDTKGNRLSGMYYYDFKSGKLLEDDQTVDEKAVAEVAKLVNALPELDKIKLEDEKEVKEARAAYDKLTEAQEKLDSAKKLDEKLVAIETKIAKLKGEAQTLDEAAVLVKAALEKFNAKNETTEAQLTEAANSVITNKAITLIVKIGDDKKAATEEKAGNIPAKVELTETKADKTKVVKDIEVNIEIAKIVPETFEVKLAGNAKQNYDYTVAGVDDLNAVRKGTELTIIAVKKITVGVGDDDEVVLEVNTQKPIIINEATTITVNIFVDKTALTDAIAAVKYVAVSTDGSDVEPTAKWTTQEAKTALEEAVTAAQAVADKSDATQKEVNDAVIALNAAVSTYTEAQADGKAE